MNNWLLFLSSLWLFTCLFTKSNPQRSIIFTILLCFYKNISLVEEPEAHVIIWLLGLLLLFFLLLLLLGCKGEKKHWIRKPRTTTVGEWRLTEGERKLKKFSVQCLEVSTIIYTFQLWTKHMHQEGDLATGPMWAYLGHHHQQLGLLQQGHQPGRHLLLRRCRSGCRCQRCWEPEKKKHKLRIRRAIECCLNVGHRAVDSHTAYLDSCSTSSGFLPWQRDLARKAPRWLPQPWSERSACPPEDQQTMRLLDIYVHICHVYICIKINP